MRGLFNRVRLQRLVRLQRTHLEAGEAKLSDMERLQGADARAVSLSRRACAADPQVLHAAVRGIRQVDGDPGLVFSTDPPSAPTGLVLDKRHQREIPSLAMLTAKFELRGSKPSSAISLPP
jgi:hypothetical protein